MTLPRQLDSGNGREGRERISPDVLQALQLDDIAVAVRQLLRLTRQRIPRGVTPFWRRTVDTTGLDTIIQPPWFSLKLVNDGPSTIFLNVNDIAEDPIRVDSGERIDFDFGVPIIAEIWVRAVSATATVRVVGLY